MCGDDLAGDGEAETTPACVRDAVARVAVEPLEDTSPGARLDARTAVDHRHADPLPLAPGRHLDVAARRAELDGVVDDVFEGMCQTPGVRARVTRLAADVDREALGRRDSSQRLDGGFDRSGQGN